MSSIKPKNGHILYLINHAIHIFSDSHSFNSEIQCVKAIAIDRGYKSSIYDIIDTPIIQL